MCVLFFWGGGGGEYSSTIFTIAQHVCPRMVQQGISVVWYMWKGSSLVMDRVTDGEEVDEAETSVTIKTHRALSIHTVH